MEKKSTPVLLGAGRLDGLRGAASARNIHNSYSLYQRGFGTLTWLLATPVFLIALLILAVIFYEGRKAYWDAQVKGMCAKDGGVRILEQVVVSSAQAKLLPKVGDHFGVVLESLSRPEEPAYSRIIETTLREHNPAVIRYKQEIIRRTDSRVIGVVISYGRGGGDFPSPSHPSSFHCPEHKQLYESISGVYKIEGISK